MSKANLRVSLDRCKVFTAKACVGAAALEIWALESET
jgi:hypothetical protein